MRPGKVIAIGVVVIGLLFGYLGGEYSAGDLRTLRQDLADAEAAIAILESENDSLLQEADALESDPVAQERAARERFGMLRDGEIMYQVIPSPQPPAGGRRP